jgi:hypothetical protein
MENESTILENESQDGLASDILYLTAGIYFIFGILSTLFPRIIPRRREVEFPLSTRPYKGVEVENSRHGIKHDCASQFDKTTNPAESMGMALANTNDKSSVRLTIQRRCVIERDCTVESGKSGDRKKM